MDPAPERDPWEGLLDEDVSRRLAAARSGQDVANRLLLGDLVPGALGRVDAWVAEAGALRPFVRRDGRDGTMRRVVLRDATGEAALVLWGSDAAAALPPGACVRAQVAVREAYRGDGVELALIGALTVLAPEPEANTHDLTGTLSLEDTVPVEGTDGTGAIRFRAEGLLQTHGGTLRIILWDDAIRQALEAGPDVVLHAMVPHPALDDHWLPTAATRVVPRPAPPAMVK